MWKIYSVGLVGCFGIYACKSVGMFALRSKLKF